MDFLNGNVPVTAAFSFYTLLIKFINFCGFYTGLSPLFYFFALSKENKRTGTKSRSFNKSMKLNCLIQYSYLY